MKKKQLNVWIPEDLREYVASRADNEKVHMNEIIVDLIKNDIIRRNGQLSERTSILAIQEVVATEIRKAHIQFRCDLREDRHLEAESFFERLHKQFDRLADFMITCMRSSGIIRRLAYTSLSQDYGSRFAREAYNDAKEKAYQEILVRKTSQEPIYDVPVS